MARKVKILNNAYIRELTMDGPIMTPVVLDDNIVYNMVIRGYAVEEINPSLNKSIRLTLANFSDPNRFGETASVPLAKPEGSPVVEVATPVTTVSSNGPVVAANVASEEAKPHMTKAEKKEARRKAAAEAAARVNEVNQTVAGPEDKTDAEPVTQEVTE